MSTKFWNIVGGPSGAQLVDAFKYAFDKLNPHRVVFTLVKTDEEKLNSFVSKKEEMLMRRVLICALEHESGTGCNFLIRGSMSVDGRDYLVSGYYDAKKHRGFLKTR